MVINRTINSYNAFEIKDQLNKELAKFDLEINDLSMGAINGKDVIAAEIKKIEK